MKELTECLIVKDKINDINDKIRELRAVISSPKGQVITGMPRGGSNKENAFDKYLIKVERLERQKKDLLKYRDSQWQKAINKLPDITEEEKALLRYRYIDGLPWKKCVVMMNKEYTKWSINRCFQVNRKAHKII